MPTDDRVNPEKPPSERPASPVVTGPIEVGADVIGTCGHKVGEVVALREDHIVVEKGFFMPIDFYIPTSAIHRNDDHGLYLNVTRDEALHEGWDVDPASARRSASDRPGPTR